MAASIPDTIWESLQVASSGTLPSGASGASCLRLHASALALLKHLYLKGDTKGPVSGLFPATSSPLLRQALEATEAFASGLRDKGLDQVDALLGVVRGQQERLGLVEASRRHPNDNTTRVDVGQRHALVQSIVNAPMPGALLCAHDCCVGSW